MHAQRSQSASSRRGHAAPRQPGRRAARRGGGAEGRRGARRPHLAQRARQVALVPVAQRVRRVVAPGAGGWGAGRGGWKGRQEKAGLGRTRGRRSGLRHACTWLRGTRSPQSIDFPRTSRRELPAPLGVNFPPVRDVEVLPEDAPVALCHLLQALLGPVLLHLTLKRARLKAFENVFENRLYACADLKRGPQSGRSAAQGVTMQRKKGRRRGSRARARWVVGPPRP